MEMGRFRYHGRLMATGLTAAALALAIGLLLIACNLNRFGFVEGEVQVRHLALLYGWGFPLVTVFLFAPMFAEETEEGVLAWLFALPFNRTVWLAERWILGMALLAGLYFGSLAVMEWTVTDLPWRYFALDLFVPSVWLGHLALAVSLLVRTTAAGLGAALGYWCLEVLSRGAIMGDASLFRAISEGEAASGGGFPYVILGLIFLCLAGCALLLHPRHFRR